jgi:rare lipoprotein A
MSKFNFLQLLISSTLRYIKNSFQSLTSVNSFNEFLKSLDLRKLKPSTLFYSGFVLLFLYSFTAKQGFEQVGNASYYAAKFEGRRTASGVVFRQDSMYCAHKTLKFGTILKVTNLKNDSTIIVKVVDRMGKTPHVIDLTKAAAKRLNFLQAGVAKVKIEQILPSVSPVDSLTTK